MENAALLNALVHNAIDGIITIDEFGIIESINPSACRLFAYSEQEVIGYYSLTVGSVIHSQAPDRVTKGQPKHPIPVMILARLAVDRRWQNRGVGRGLLKDALKRTAQAADLAGIRALLVHAKDADVRRWYERFNFEPSEIDPLSLFLLLKDLKKVVEID